MTKMVKVLEINTEDECNMIVLPYGSKTAISTNIDIIVKSIIDDSGDPVHIVKSNIKKKNNGKYIIANISEDNQVISFPKGQIKY